MRYLGAIIAVWFNAPRRRRFRKMNPSVRVWTVKLKCPFRTGYNAIKSVCINGL